MSALELYLCVLEHVHMYVYVCTRYIHHTSVCTFSDISTYK